MEKASDKKAWKVTMDPEREKFDEPALVPETSFLLNTRLRCKDGAHSAIVIGNHGFYSP
ncbi:unnamed protein product [Arabidopsis thaliana]|uniref:Uncharacterized protein n=1 Tax=Arabidopsis thaliana TaxID=3702 RepID=A0A654FED2_ARATH|nr:unnamed protein product [Arabidopsis thaliana]